MPISSVVQKPVYTITITQQTVHCGQLYFQATGCIWRLQVTFGGYKLHLEATSYIWRLQVVFGDYKLHLEATSLHVLYIYTYF